MNIINQSPPKSVDPVLRKWLEQQGAEMEREVPPRILWAPAQRINLATIVSPRPDGWDIFPLVIATPYSKIPYEVLIRSNVDVAASADFYTLFDLKHNSMPMLPAQRKFSTSDGLKMGQPYTLWDLETATVEPQFEKGDNMELWRKSFDNTGAVPLDGPDVTIQQLVEIYIQVAWFAI